MMICIVLQLVELELFVQFLINSLSHQFSSNLARSEAEIHHCSHRAFESDCNSQVELK